MSIISLESIATVKPRKRVLLDEIKRKIEPETLSEKTFGVYFPPEEPNNPFPDHHTIGIDDSPERRDGPLRTFVLNQLHATNFAPSISDLVSKSILSFEQLPLDSKGNTRLRAAERHERMHELQAIRFGDVHQAQRAEAIFEKLESLSWQKGLKKRCMNTINTIDNVLLHVRALDEAQAMTAELVMPDASQNLILNAHFILKQLLMGFENHHGLDLFEVIIEYLRETDTLFERNEIGSVQHTMGAVILFLQRPNIWQDLISNAVAYPDLRLDIKNVLEKFLIDPQAIIQPVNSRLFQTTLDQTLMTAINQYHQTLQNTENFLTEMRG